MERNRIHRLVVVADDDKTLPIGVLSATDVVHAIAENARVAAARAGRTPDAAPEPAGDA
jgi:CBS domain-containing protein